jgi:hypothetical protein
MWNKIIENENRSNSIAPMTLHSMWHISMPSQNKWPLHEDMISLSS